MEQQILNNEAVISLYNRMQNSLIKFKELKCQYMLNAFEIFQIHTEGTLNIFEDNIIWQLALSVFKDIFQANDNFKQVNKESIEYINVLIGFSDIKNKNSSSLEAKRIMLDILLEKEKKELYALNKILFDLNIEEKVIYLYFLLLKFEIDNTQKLIEYLALILKNKYSEIDFFFHESIGIDFFAFIEKLTNFFEANKLENYSVIKYDQKIEGIVVIKKSITEIEKIIGYSQDVNKEINSEKKKQKENKKPKLNIGNQKKRIHKKTKDEQNKEIKGKTKDEIKDATIKEIKEENNEKKIDELKGKISNEINEEKNNRIESLIKIDEYNDINHSELNKKFEDLHSEYMRIQKENEEIKKENEEIKKENEEIKKENKKIKKENEEIKKEIEEVKQKYAKIQDENKDIKQKYADIQKKYAKTQTENSAINKKYKEILTQNKKIEYELTINKNRYETLNNKLMDLKSETKNLNFILKTIGLRNAYKTLIDSFMIFFNMEGGGGLIEKTNQINQKLSNFKTRNSRIFSQFFCDIKALLNYFNDKAHQINDTTNIYQELCVYLQKYTQNQIYSNIQNFIKKIGVEEEFNEFVLIRNNKIKTSKKEYLTKENAITKKINDKINREEFNKILMEN